MANTKELIDFKKAMTNKYGPDFNSKLTESEFWHYMKLKGKKFGKSWHQKKSNKNPAVSYEKSGIH